MVIRTEIYSKDDIIYEQGTLKDKVIYVARGGLTILSVEDHESAILTLGMGTLLGEACLMYGSRNLVQVFHTRRVNLSKFLNLSNSHSWVSSKTVKK